MAAFSLSDINRDSGRMLPVSLCADVETTIHELLPG
jgi:hypothetical protein